MIVVGLMSGTSVDGIDAAVVELDERGHDLTARLIAYRESAIDEALRRRVHQLFDPSTSRIDEVCELNALLGESFAEAARQALADAGSSADLVASHGQTIWHQVRDRRVTATLQIAEPSVIAERLGITVVADFRPRDVAAGGQGAPLSSYPDALLFADARLGRAIQNLGGIGNVTWLPPGGGHDSILAFDTGPANSLIDHAVWRLTDGAYRYDRDGRMAAAGAVDEHVLAELLAHPYFKQPPPKSTGRELFGSAFADEVVARIRRRGGTAEDVVATLTAFTVRSIADAYRRFLPQQPDEVVLGGGGARNPTMRHWLADALAPSILREHDDFGLPSSGREAIYFAILGYQAFHGRHNTMAACTGARHPVVMGKIVPGANYAALVRAIDPSAEIRRLRIL